MYSNHVNWTNTKYQISMQYILVHIILVEKMRLRLKCFGSNLLQRSLKLTQGATGQSNLQGKGLLRWHRNLRNFSFAEALIFVPVQTILVNNEVTAGSSHHSLPKVSWYLVVYLTHYEMKVQKIISILPPSSTDERTTNNDIRSSYSTPLPLQSISFITSSSNSQSHTQKKLKIFPLPGTATEPTRVCP